MWTSDLLLCAGEYYLGTKLSRLLNLRDLIRDDDADHACPGEKTIWIRPRSLQRKLHKLRGSSPTGSPTHKKPRLSLFNFLPPSQCRPLEVKSGPSEVNKYAREQRLPLGQNVLNCWRNMTDLPELRNLAKDFLGMTATSAPSERAFSHAGILYSPKRAKLNEKTFSRLMLIRCNQQQLQKMV